MLIELVRDAAAEVPERPAVLTGSRRVDYGEVAARAQNAAAWLDGVGAQRLGVALEDPVDILVVLAAASMIGCEACVYPRDLDDASVDELASRLSQPLVVADRPRALESARAIRLAEAPRTPIPIEVSEGPYPVLILTTGTTGTQKGVRHDWERLVRGVRHPDDRGGSRWLLTYNLNQFAGIQLLLHVLVSRATLVVPSSRQPRQAIDAMLERDVTHVSATPTFWRLLVGTVTAAEARSLRLEQITLGGEATPEALIERLRRMFPAARISHVYAGTEFGSAVSVGDGRSGLPASVLSRSEGAEVRMRIVDGELQVRSRFGMLGYHDNDTAEGEWCPTGDLVELRGDRIHFIGRTTEVINVGGAKVHPLPIEHLVSSVEGVGLAAVYGRPNPITGQIVAVDVVAAPGADQRRIEAEIRKACEALPPAGRPRRIRFVPELTLRGNKLIRHEAEVRG